MGEVNGKVLWHVGFFDGPLSGVVLVEEPEPLLCWFETPADPGDDERPFLVYELTAEEVADEVLRHFMFEAHVGLHTCNHATLDGKRPRGMVRPQAPTGCWPSFYDWSETLPKRDRTANKTPIGTLLSHDNYCGFCLICDEPWPCTAVTASTSDEETQGSTRGDEPC